MQSIESLAASLRNLLAASNTIESDAPSSEFLQQVIDSQVFRPSESERMVYWFARYLTVRESIWEVIDQAVEGVGTESAELLQNQDWRYFIIAYSAACLLVRNDRLMLFKVAKHSVVQRKLNEAQPDYRIPRKQYTRIFSAYVDSQDALQIYRAIKIASTHRTTINDFQSDPEVGFLVERFPEFESWLDPRRRKYLKWFVAYLSHKWRRKGVVTLTRALSRTVEGFGRVASEFRTREHKRVTVDTRAAVQEILQPGDILITRHDHALTNLFLPGFWPHAALYVGFNADEAGRELIDSDSRINGWAGDCCVLEALKDGVHFRPLAETLDVDNFVVLRPELDRSTIGKAIARAVKHAGKPYNFDFDFFNEESLVCTEVIYRAYDGFDGIAFPLSERAGRYSLSAEDIIDYGASSGTFTAVAVFGPEPCSGQLVCDDRVRHIIEYSLIPDPSQ